MDCLDCGKTLAQVDLLAVSCQGCGEPLMPDDISNLEAKLGIVKEAPEIEAPVLVPEGGIKIPDMQPCKNEDCRMPLYGSEIPAYMSGAACQYCGKPDPSASTPKPVESTKLEPEEDTDSKQKPIDTSNKDTSQPEPESFTGKHIRARFCTGPLAGREFNLPTGIITGKQFFKDLVAAESKNSGADSSWYSKCISRISREHFKLAEDGTITDMGSANGTILDREEIFGEGDKFALGTVLNLAGELSLTRVHAPVAFIDTGDIIDPKSIRITHQETNITIDVPQGVEFHLGRLREDGRREPYALAISDHMKGTDGMDEDEIRRISRRHATVELLENGEIKVQNIAGKLVTIRPITYVTFANSTLDDTKNSYLLPYDEKNNSRLNIELGKSQYSITRC
jgi:hypothetical protein